MKKRKVILVACIVVILIIGGCFLVNTLKQSSVNQNNNKVDYIIQTDAKFITLQNDGGTYYDQKYEISFSDKSVVKLEDHYIGFKGYEYQNKVLYEKNLSEEEVSNLKSLIKSIIDNKEKYDIDDENSDFYYVLKNNSDEEIKIYNRDVIFSLEKLLKENV